MRCPKCQFENPADTVFCGKCGTKLDLAASSFSVTRTLETTPEGLGKGELFAGRFELIEELGTGGMGKVYQAFDKKIGEEVALKLLHPEIALDERTVDRFRNEIKLARRITHKNVCRLHELHEEGKTLFITMEYVSGQDLKGLIRETGALSTGKAISIAKQVAEGLAEAHDLGVVHRDLKPQNIMVDKEGLAKIMDFGIARSLRAAGMTAEGMIIGTPEYMAPEQVEGQETDQGTDIYALGAILFEMVAGRAPFGGDSPLSVAYKHKNELPLPPQKLNSQVPEPLNGLILRCLEKEKENRYQTADELLADLVRIEEGLPISERVVLKARPTIRIGREKPSGLRKFAIPALGLIVLALAAFIVLRILPEKQPASPTSASGKPSLAIMYFENNTGDENLDPWRKMLADSLITDLSQSKYLRVLSGDRLFEILSHLGQLDAKTYSAEVLKEVARQGNAGYILSGKYARMGDVFRIDVVIQDAIKGEIIGSDRVEARGENEVFPQVDELTRRIKAGLNLSVTEIAGDIDREVGQITTHFPEAYIYYMEGRDYHSKGDYPNAVQSYEKALAIDPEFAMVYIALADVYQQPTYYFGKNRKYAQKALEFSGRLSDKERLIVEGTFYSVSEETWDKAIETYSQLLELYPDDLIGNKNLGELYYQLERWDEAIERFLVCRENKDESYSTYLGAADAYAAKGLYDEAEEMLGYYLGNVSDNSQIHVGLIQTYLHRGKYDLALAEVDKAFPPDKKEDNNSFWKGYVYFLRGDLSTAEKEYLKLLAKGENAGVRRLLHGIYLTQGKFNESINQLEKALESSNTELEKSFRLLGLSLAHMRSGSLEKALEECEEGWAYAVEADILRLQRYALHIKGLVYLGMKSTDQALEAANELKALIERGIKRKEVRMHYDLMGVIELEKNNPTGAIEYLNKAVILLPSQSGTEGGIPLFMDHLAAAYFKAGDDDEARKAYEKITALTTNRYLYGDIYAKSFYMLGKIDEKQGNTSKAVANYHKFLDLWKDADSGIAEVEEAKSRLAALN
jgi:serine/threonine protein kinase/predicted Zn-dependent protease